jgi:hypothetical protein
MIIGCSKGGVCIAYEVLKLALKVWRADLIGQTLANRFRVESFLGRGGMADVYKVCDIQRSVYLAMKVSHEDLAQDKVFLRRFKREAQTLARLQQ